MTHLEKKGLLSTGGKKGKGWGGWGVVGIISNEKDMKRKRYSLMLKRKKGAGERGNKAFVKSQYLVFNKIGRLARTSVKENARLVKKKYGQRANTNFHRKGKSAEGDKRRGLDDRKR